MGCQLWNRDNCFGEVVVEIGSGWGVDSEQFSSMLEAMWRAGLRQSDSGLAYIGCWGLS